MLFIQNWRVMLVLDRTFTNGGGGRGLPIVVIVLMRRREGVLSILQNSRWKMSNTTIN